MKYLLIAVSILSANVLHAADIPELGKNTNRAIDKYQEKVNETIADVQEELNDAREDLLKALQKEYKSLMRKGDLDAVKKLQERIAVIETEQQTDDNSLFGGERNKENVRDLIAKKIEAKHSLEDAKNPATAKALKHSIVIKKAEAKRLNSNAPSINVQKALQDYINSGKHAFRPVDALRKATGIKNNAELKVTYTCNGKQQQVRLLWKQNFDYSIVK